MKSLYFILICFCFSSCNDQGVPLPKPRIYPKIEFPTKEYIQFENNNCPFEMSIPKYFQFVKDSNKVKSEERFTCWFDLHCSELNTYIHFSYLSVENNKGLETYIQDAFEMADKHNVKANYRDEVAITNTEKNLYGLLFKIDGPVASPTQFFLTDSINHFLRGSLYYNDIVNRDSILPVHNFLQDDIDMIIKSFKWK